MKNTVYRTCKGCKIVKNREEMIKITLVKGEIFINPNSSLSGRSVYVCKSAACIKNLIKTKGLKRGLKFNDEVKIKAIENILLRDY